MRAVGDQIESICLLFVSMLALLVLNILFSFCHSLFDADLLVHCLFSVAECYEFAMLPEHMNSPDPTVGPNSITETGALCISSGSRSGRVPKQKRIVEDDMTRDVSNRAQFTTLCRFRLLLSKIGVFSSHSDSHRQIKKQTD